MNIDDIIGLISSVGKAGTGIMSAFEKQGYPPGYQEALQAQSDARHYLAASANPNSPYFRNIAETEELRGRGDLIASVDQIIRQLASRSATGRGTINPERRDEAVWGVLAKGFQEAGIRARELARQKLVEMAGGSSRMASGYDSTMRIGAATDWANRQSRLTGLSGAFDTAGRLGQTIKNNPTAPTGTVQHGANSVPDWWSSATPGMKDWYYRPWGA